MRLQSRRAEEEKAAAMSLLRDRVDDLEDEVRQVCDANRRLAAALTSAREELALADQRLVAARAALADIRAAERTGSAQDEADSIARDNAGKHRDH